MQKMTSSPFIRDDECEDEEEQLMDQLLVKLDPHDILPNYVSNNKKEDSICKWIFGVFLGSWLVIYSSDNSEDIDMPNDEDIREFKQQLLPSLLLMRKEPKRSGGNYQKRVLVGKTLFNALLFSINLYTLVFHTVFSEPETVGNGEGDQKCQVKFYATPKPPVLELLLLSVYIITPVLIAHQFKVVWENDSFVTLKKLDDLIRRKCKRVSTQVKEELKRKTRRSLLFSLICILIGLAGAISLVFLQCPHGSIFYTVALFVFVTTFLISSLFAIIVPYNMIRFYASFIIARTAVFLAELKEVLSAYDDSMTAANKEAEEVFQKKELVEAVQKTDELSPTHTLIEKIKYTEREMGLFLEARKFVARSNLEEKLKARYRGAEEMFERIKYIHKKMESPVAFALGCLFVIGLVTFLYILYYSLFFFQDIWPQIEYQPSVTTTSPSAMPSEVPSEFPSSSPSGFPSSSPTSTYSPTSDATYPLGMLPPPRRPPRSDGRYESDLGSEIRQIVDNIWNLEPHIQNGMLFFLTLLAALFITILYSWKLLLLFAQQVDALTKLSAFCESRMAIEHDDNGYGPKFERLGIFIKSSTETSGWMFLAVQRRGTAVISVRKQMQKRVIGSVGAIVIAQFLGSLPNLIGVTNSESNQDFLEKLGKLFSDQVTSLQGSLR
mmetsp:Transcript_12224/g.26612  ORF Transcript_12224/g.26612 Transcript_12224/m.26612 type:complete len:665 (+) Transcript_12224:196-2190(+)